MTAPYGGAKRAFAFYDITIANGGNQSEALDFSQLAGGMIYVPASFSGNIGFYVSNVEDGTFAPALDETGTLIAITADTENWQFIPAKLFPALWVKVWSQTGGSNTNQSADRALIVMGKS